MICADDFGMADDINRATVELALSRKIDAVSCMVKAPFFSSREFAGLDGRVKTGLHFTLTETAGGLRRLTARAYLRAISRQAVCDELSRQFELFRELTGKSPEFIDGHLHVQQLPVVRDVLVEFVRTACIEPGFFVRNAVVPFRFCRMKSLLISLPGRALRRKLKKAEIRTNDGFGGIYNYAGYAHYSRHLETFLKTVSGDGVIMVHPGLNEPWRRAEYEVLRARRDGLLPF